jgi:probable phosphoglycerate mutase
MKILIIRHAEPDYENNTITEKGWREAHMLAERLAKLPISDVYVSPMGRAQHTAQPYLELTGK